jgi:hypothetical protein
MSKGDVGVGSKVLVGTTLIVGVTVGCALSDGEFVITDGVTVGCALSDGEFVVGMTVGCVLSVGEFVGLGVGMLVGWSGAFGS